MRKTFVRYLFIAVLLIALAAALHYVHYLIFHDPHHIFIYLLGDVAFLPLEVLFVAIVVERLLAHQEHKSLIKKLNMLVGTFFGELGTRLLGELTKGLANADDIRPYLNVRSDWRAADYKRSLARVRTFGYEFDQRKLDLGSLRDLLTERRNLLLMLLANPNLLEHERFTDLLWAVFHLMEELSARESLSGLPETDLKHLGGDVRRVYSMLTSEWLYYCRHLQRRYPYIFSIIVRTHPLQETPNATVR